MEIKINFDQLFEAPNELNTTQQTPSSQLERSFQTLNDSFEYQLTFDPHFFQKGQSKSPQPNLLIDQSQHSEQNLSDETKKSVKSPHSSQSAHTPKPGERLYYESQANQMRKLMQREKVENEKQAALKRLHFAPAINEKSRRMAEKTRELAKIQKAKKEVKTTEQIKEEQALKQCTFQPKTLNKSNKSHTKSKEELFYMLHSASKIKQIKMAHRVEEEARNTKVIQKKIPEAQFQDFLKRNQDYANITKKKLELMKQSANTYDFRTGEKLFSPKISDNRPHQFPLSHSPKQKPQPPSVQPFNTYDIQPKPCGIFKKKQSNTNTLTFPDNNHEEQTFQKVKMSGKEEQQYAQIYRQYSEEYDRKVAHRQVSLSHHQPILEEPEQQVQWSDKVQFAPEEEENLWNSAEDSHGIQDSKVRQFLAGSEEDEPEARNNYVMDILSNLIHLKQQDEEDEE